MAQVHFKRGTAADLAKEQKQDGLLSFTIDDGRLHLDYLNQNNELVRKTFYSGKLTIGPHVFDGTNDVNIGVYDGETEEG